LAPSKGKLLTGDNPDNSTSVDPTDLASLFGSIGLLPVSPRFGGPPAPRIGITTRSDIGGGAAPMGRRRGWSTSSTPWVRRTKHKRGISGGGPRGTALSISAPASPTSRRLGNSSDANLNSIRDSADDDDGEGDGANEDDSADHGSGSRRGRSTAFVGVDNDKDKLFHSLERCD